MLSRVERGSMEGVLHCVEQHGPLPAVGKSLNSGEVSDSFECNSVCAYHAGGLRGCGI
jgi:hypothetical protein